MTNSRMSMNDLTRPEVSRLWSTALGWEGSSESMTTLQREEFEERAWRSTLQTSSATRLCKSSACRRRHCQQQQYPHSRSSKGPGAGRSTAIYCTISLWVTLNGTNLQIIFMHAQTVVPMQVLFSAPTNYLRWPEFEATRVHKRVAHLLCTLAVIDGGVLP